MVKNGIKLCNMTIIGFFSFLSAFSTLSYFKVYFLENKNSIHVFLLKNEEKLGVFHVEFPVFNQRYT